MDVKQEIENYIAGMPESKCSDMQELHKLILKMRPKCKLWFLDGRDAKGKVVSNPNVGYGTYTINYANGTSREFYRIGMSANTSGISVYVMGLEDKTYLANTYGKNIGKAAVSGYCIKFKRLKDINIDVLMEAIKYGLEQGE